MPVGAEKEERGARTARISAVNFTGGWSTRTFATEIAENELYVADNIVFNRDGLVSKRPGNVARPSGSTMGAGDKPILAMTRVFALGPANSTPGASMLIAHCADGKLYYALDGGAFILVPGSGTTGPLTLSTTIPCHFAQVYDPDYQDAMGAAKVVIIVDGGGGIVPLEWGGVGSSLLTVQTLGNFLPNDPSTGVPVQPKYVTTWGPYLVYAGDTYGTGALYISDALRPQRFTGIAAVDSTNGAFAPYYPAGRSGRLGTVTGINIVGDVLVCFLTSGVVSVSNSGTYGAFQFSYKTISTDIGCPAPNSIVGYGYFIIFFGGNGFYATDGSHIQQLPDKIPTVYKNNSVSSIPSEIVNKSTVVGIRYGSQYWASYYAGLNGTGALERVVIFDMSANGGYSFGGSTSGSDSGGAWSRWIGMNVQCGIQLRGPGDDFSMYWGDSILCRVAQHDTNVSSTAVYDDFGTDITVVIQAKAFFLDRPDWVKTVQNFRTILEYNVIATYTDSISPFCSMDGIGVAFDTVNPQLFANTPQYGNNPYGTFAYGPQLQFYIIEPLSFPIATLCQGYSVSPGITEHSSKSFNLVGFVIEVSVDPPSP